MNDTVEIPVYILCIPSRKLTYPTWGKGKSSSNMPYHGDRLIPWRVFIMSSGFQRFNFHIYLGKVSNLTNTC